MRTNEERIEYMHDRAIQIKQEQKKKKVRLMQIAATVASFAAVIIIAVFMPHFASPETGAGSVPENMNASIFSSGKALGYIVIAVIAFILGVFVTAFCIRLKKWQESKNKEE